MVELESSVSAISHQTVSEKEILLVTFDNFNNDWSIPLVAIYVFGKEELSALNTYDLDKNGKRTPDPITGYTTHPMRNLHCSIHDDAQTPSMERRPIFPQPQSRIPVNTDEVDSVAGSSNGTNGTVLRKLEGE